MSWGGLVKLVQHEGQRIVVRSGERTWVVTTLHSTYYHRSGGLVAQQVQRWHLGEQEIRVWRPVVRRTRWPLGRWRI